jgi:hypothetical protein
VILNSSEFSVRTYINRNEIKALKAGDGKNVPWKVWKSDLMEFINRNNGVKDKDINNDELYTINDCCVVLRSSITTVKKWLKSNELKSFKLGSGVRPIRRIWKSDLLEFINKRSNMDELEKKND